MAPHCSTLAWKIPWREEPGRLRDGVEKSRTWLSDFTFTFHFHALEKEMATHSSVLAWRIPGTGEPGRLPSMGSHRVGHDWRDLAAAAAAKQRISQVAEQYRIHLPMQETQETWVRIPGSGRSPGGGNGNPLTFLPGEFHGQRSLAGYSPWGRTVRHDWVGMHLLSRCMGSNCEGPW